MAWLNDRRPDWSRADLLPVVVEDAVDGGMLMLAWASADAVAATVKTGHAHFWSRSRNELWRKGATSGNVMEVLDISVDCDGDAIRYRARASGPACHTGARSCFETSASAVATSAGEGERTFDLEALAAIVAARRASDPASSYTAQLLAAGARRAAEKVTEEAGELAAAALVGTGREVVAEAADLLYHALVLLEARDVPLGDVIAELERRHREPR